MKTAHAPTTHRQLFRQRADAILNALIHAPLPETYAEIIRAARAVMTVDKMLCQLWPQSDEKEDALPAVAMPAKASQPLNRHQRRAEAAKQKRPAILSPSLLCGEEGPLAKRMVDGVAQDAANTIAGYV